MGKSGQMTPKMDLGQQDIGIFAHILYQERQLLEAPLGHLIE